MAARRSRHRRRRNRGRFGILYKLLSFLLILAAVLVGCVVFFRVNTVVVSGESPYTEEEIITASGVEQGENLFTLNKVAIGRKIVRELPYIDEVMPVRKLPDTLVITVTQTQAVAMLEHEGEFWLLDSRCKLLERGNTDLAEGLPEVMGLTPLAPAEGTSLAVAAQAQKRLEQLKQLLAALQEREMTEELTGFIDLTAANEIRFGYGDDLTVIFPMEADFDSKTYALKRTLEKMDEEGIARTGTLDFTYGDNQARLLPERWLPDKVVQVETPEPVPSAEPTPG